MHFKLLLLLIVTCASFVQGDEAYQRVGIDPASLVEISNKTYYLSPQGVTLSALDAEKFCTDSGLELISFETPEEYDLVKEYLQKNNRISNIWTSGQKIKEIWGWAATNEPFTFAVWSSALYPCTSGHLANLYFQSYSDWSVQISNVKFFAEFMCELN